MNWLPSYTSYDHDSTEAMTCREDGRLIARQNELRCLRAIHRLGWLRTRDLAALCWTRWQSRPTEPPNLACVEPTASAVRMAQRTMQRMLTARMVIRGQGPNGSVIYALSEGGARALKESGVAAASGKDIIRGFSSAYYRHRLISNQIAISAIIQGYRVSTEREIAQGLWLGGKHGIAGKRPDVLIRNGGQLNFIEVEKSRKNAKDYQALLAWLNNALRDSIKRDGPRLLGPGQTWGKVIFVCRPAFANRLRNDLIEAGWTVSQINSLTSFKSTLYNLEDTLFS